LRSVPALERPVDSTWMNKAFSMKKIIFLLIPLVLLYLFSETILSAINLSPFVPIPELTRPVENSRVSQWGEIRVAKDLIYGSPRAIGSGGYRAFLPPVARRNGVKRITLIGDAHIAGFGIRDYEILPFYLSGYLHYYKPELLVEMVNLGIPGSDTTGYAERCQKFKSYQSDLVVFGFTISNDAQIEETSLSKNSGPNRRRANVKVIWDMLTNLRGLRDAVLTHSRTLSLLYRPIRRWEAKARRNLFMKLTFDDSRKWKKVKQNLAKISQCYGKDEIRVVMVIFPHMYSSRYVGLNDIKDYPFDHYHQKLIRVAHSFGFIVVDFLDYFRQGNIDSFDDYIVDGDGHPNGKFHAFVAKRFAAELLERSLL